MSKLYIFIHFLRVRTEEKEGVVGFSYDCVSILDCHVSYVPFVALRVTYGTYRCWRSGI